MLDEQSFQGLLAAAFTIQEHQDRQSHRDPAKAPSSSAVVAPEPADLCQRCGAEMPSSSGPCPNCGSGEELRPGEALQRRWASMWLMSQEQGILRGSDELAEGTDKPELQKVRRVESANSGLLSVAQPQTMLPLSETEARSASELPAPFSLAEGRLQVVPEDIASEQTEISWPDEPGPHPVESEPVSFVDDDLVPAEAAAPAEAALLAHASPSHGLTDLRVKLRFHRADLYLGIAVFVAVMALAWPSVSPQTHKISAWNRFLIAVGIAEEAPPAVHYRGDPNMKVWVDTHTALYYCPGDALYGKSKDGHFTTQGEAQADRFEPAERSACVR